MLKQPYTCIATDFVVYQPTFTNCIPKIENPIVKKLKKIFERIVKIEISLKRDFMQFGRKRKKEIGTQKRDIEPRVIHAQSVVAYPASDIREVLMIMNSLKLNSIPVVKNPWNKEFVGYVKKETLEIELDKD